MKKYIVELTLEERRSLCIIYFVFMQTVHTQKRESTFSKKENYT